MTTLQLLRLERRIGQPALAKLSGVPQPTSSDDGLLVARSMSIWISSSQQAGANGQPG